LAVSTDGNGRLCYLEPRIGGARLVYEAALNVAVTGARPMAVVDNLNFGNPEKPEVMWQFKESVEGISQACEVLQIPVVGGNVSFYNETDGVDINPTPVVGLLGLADPMPLEPPRLSRATEGMDLWLVGPEASDNLAGTAVQRLLDDGPGGIPTAPDPATACRVIALAAELAHTAPVLHDISDGGLAVAAAEISIASGIGVSIEVPEAEIFSEDPHRFLVGIAPGSISPPAESARKVGVFGGDRIVINGSPLGLDTAASTYRDALPRRMR
ncbi:MAG: AIR synthase related protein, partial [Acidimicrobiia bacterium]